MVFRTADDHPALPRIRQLLEVAFDGAFSDDDWRHTLGGWHVVLEEGGQPVAHAAVVPRALEADGRAPRCGYVEGVATAPQRQGEGLGTRAMTELDAVVRTHFEVGALSTDRQAFYERVGWERWRGPTFVRDGGRLRRTAAEDDGILVLRFGPSRDVDLASHIVCEARVGDDW